MKVFLLFSLFFLPALVFAQEPVMQAPVEALSGSGFLAKALEAIAGFLEADSFLQSLKVFIPIFFLGFLHAFQPGHGKSIFTVFLIDHQRSFADVLRFSSILTVTHLLDVILLGTGIYFFASLKDVSQYMNLLQQIAAIGLMAVSIFVLFFAFKNFKKPRENCPKDSKKTSAFLGIFAGLAPCTYGWAILMTIISLGKTEWIFPVLVVFGLGLFTALFFFGFLAVKLKDSISSRFRKIIPYTPFLSGGLLFFFALQMFLWVFQL